MKNYTKEAVKEMFNFLSESDKPQDYGESHLLFMVDYKDVASRICDTLEDMGLVFTAELCDDGCTEIEVYC